MPGYQKKSALNVSSIGTLFNHNSLSLEKILQKTVHKKRALWWIFFLAFKKQIFICTLVQIILLSLALTSPFIIQYYISFFVNSNSMEIQKKLIYASLYIFSFMTLIVLASYLKKKLMVNWKREIEYHSLSLMAQITCFSSKEQSNIMLNKFTDAEGKFFAHKFMELPNIFCLFFSFPALIASFFLIYNLMDKLFLIPVALLLLTFFLQIKNQVYLARVFKKISFFLETRSQLLKKIFLYGNRVHLLAMESFFIGRMNTLQQNANNITVSVLNKTSIAKVIFYYSGFIIAIPSLICYFLIHKNATLPSITALLTFFILVAYFYSNILSFLSRRQHLKSSVEVLNSSIHLIKKYHLEELKADREEDFDENLDFISSSPSFSQEKIWFHKASFMSPKGIRLYNVSYDHKPGTVVAIIGAPGSGKSSFLAACAHELRLISGDVKLPQNFEIMPQQISLFDGTIRENIILGHEFEGRRYIDTVRACYLEAELNLLEDGDETIIAPKDHQFSESFIRKINLARMLYAKSEFYYFDEPFLGLSKNEISHIFNEGILKHLHGLNRIVITQKLELASLCDYILVMKEGMVVEQGNHKSLIEKAGVYAKLHYAGADSRQFGLSFQAKPTALLQNIEKSNSDNHHFYDFSTYSKAHEIQYIRQIFASTKYFLVSYFKKKNPYFSFMYVLASQIFICLAFYSLFSKFASDNMSKYVQIILFGFFSVLAILSFYFFHVKNEKINTLFGSALEKKVYDVLIKEYHENHTYTASYLERFSKVKEDLFSSLTSIMVRVSFVLAGILLLAMSNISALLLLFSLFIFTSVFILIKKTSFIRCYFNLQAEKMRLSRSRFQFLNSLTAPNSYSYKLFLYNKFEEDVSLSEEQSQNIDHILVSFYRFIAFSMIAGAAISILFFVAKYNTTQMGTVILAFLAVVFFFEAFIHLENDLQKFVKSIPYFENLMRTSTSYKEIENQHYSTSDIWPQNASIHIMSLTTQKTKDIPKPIMNLDLFIVKGSNFGMIVDKGYVKISPLFASLLLFVPFETGTIVIDDEDILRLNPLELRDRFAYISMESLFPFLTLRENLDPSEQFDDSEIWSVLNRVGVAQSVAVLRNGLNTKIEDFPRQMYWSGEMILFSFAKALLYKNKIVLIDNLILSEDAEQRVVDLLLQDFINATVLIAAHPKSILLSVCSNIINFEGGQAQRVQGEKFSYYPPVSYENGDYSKNI
ncbi:ATP-binding cassette domain-containing protein [Silvanigrella aquatica]|uniref:ABC transporter domain-containing protein n=1 Tax=Silvanigrella aquatica TaxID=1915309 RepID=A0A1L4D100_9BACT|nr:ATP-binding cassette domain-containing protein [Silvanigrella aquatica]APJ03867.1 hypothetical protein AXG55_08085 [Silvanigrella aquatica]